MSRRVHFILLGNELTETYRRAIRTAAVHEAPITLWVASVSPDIEYPDVSDLGNVECLRWPVPSSYLSKQAAHVYDVLAWRIGMLFGGLVIGLDTISLKPAWDLLGNNELVVSEDWPKEDHANWPNCYNNNFLCKSKSGIMGTVYRKSLEEFVHDKQWGATGPLLLTQMVRDYPEQIGVAQYPTLCGWSPGYIWRFYLGLERPHPNTRIIHLCQTAYRLLIERRYDEWAAQYPDYADPVRRRTNLNDDILAS